MKCGKYGTQLPASSLACPNCGASVDVDAPSNHLSKRKQKKFLIGIVLVAVIFVVAIIAHLIAYSGYEAFLKTYLKAVESGDREEILSCHSWEDVQKKMEQNEKDKYTSMFIWENLEDYVRSNDDLYDTRIMGHEIPSWEIIDSNRNYFTLTHPSMWVEVQIRLIGTSDDVIATICMEKGKDGWYATRVDAIWASLADG